MGDVVRYFVGNTYWLSNFYPAPIIFEGAVYGTVEHAFQAAKTLDPGERRTVREIDSGYGARRVGRSSAVSLRADWERVKVGYMEALLRAKFIRHPSLGKLLRETGDKRLEEGNTWGDHFWGVCDGKGSNVLGLLLMEIRRDLIEGQKQNGK